MSIDWAGGLFEGEGCITFAKVERRKDSIRTMMQLTTCDKDVLEKFVSIIGVGEVKGPYKGQREGYKDRYLWAVQNMYDCLYSVGQLYPHLGARRKAKADELIQGILQRWEPNG